MTLRCLLCCVLSIGAVSRAMAADPPALTLRAAVDEAIAHNPDLRALASQLEADRSRPAEERALMPPMFEAQLWQWPLTTISPAGATWMLTLRQELPGRGKRGLRAALADADAGMTASAAAVRARDVVAGVERAYADLFLARKSIEVSAQTLGLLRQMADATQLRYAAGKSMQQDVVKAILEISRLEEERLMLEEQERMAAARFNALLGRDPSQPVVAMADPVPDQPAIVVADVQRVAIDRQPELAMARAGIARAEAALRLAKAERKPDFVVGGGYMTMPDERYALTASVGITWPNAPWARGRGNGAEARAGLDLAAAQARYDAAASGVRLMVHEAAVKMEAAARRVRLLATSVVPQSSQALEVSRVGYQSDRASLLDVIDNQRVLAQARLAYFKALADLERARADLERAVGAPREE